MINKNRIIQLESINWNFFEKNNKLTKKLHWYPGTFPQEIPATIIQALSKENDLIFDPFGGIGTTLAEALRLNRKCIVSDINPVALLSSYVSALLLLVNKENYLLMKVYLEYLVHLLSNNEKNVLDFGDTSAFYDFDSYFSELIQPVPDIFFNQIIVNLPQYDLLRKWIDDESIDEIKKIYSMIDNEQQYTKKIILLEMLSNALFSSSSQRKSWGHIADNVYPKQMENRKDAFISACKRWINNKARKLISFESTCSFNEKRAYVFQQNWLDDINDCFDDLSFDLLITSPPYANAIDYIKSQKLSLYLFGYSDADILSCCKNEIGARTRRTHSDSTEKWASDLIASTEKHISLAKSDSIYAYILPSEDEKRVVGNKSLLDFLISKNKELVFEVDRSINQMRTTQSWTSIKKEKILILKSKRGRK